MKKYLLACSCGTKTPVGVGQAGGTLVCSSCGATLAVPKLRDLSQLPLAAAATTNSRRGWGLSQGMLLAGGFTALLAWGAAAWLGRTVDSPVDPEAIRQNVSRQTDAQIYEAWKKHFSTTTVSRPQMVVEKQFAQQTFLRQGIAVALVGVGGIATIIGLVGGIGLARRRRSG